MTKAGDKVLKSLEEAVSIAKGEIPAARITINGHTYAPAAEIERLTAENERLRRELRNCADLLVLGDEVGNPNETELAAYREAQKLLNQQTTVKED